MASKITQEKSCIDRKVMMQKAFSSFDMSYSKFGRSVLQLFSDVYFSEVDGDSGK